MVFKMFKVQTLTQTNKTNLRKNIANREKHILRKIGLRFRNPKFEVLCTIGYVFL